MEVIWDEKSSIWRCCGTNEHGQGDCGVTTSEWFPGPAPADLSILYPKDRWTAPLPPPSEQYSPLVPATQIAVAESVTTAATGAESTSFDSSASRSTTTSSTAAGTAKPTSGDTAASGDGNQQARKGGLENQDKIGIAVGVPSGLGALVTIVGFVLKRMKRRRKRKDEGNSQ